MKITIVLPYENAAARYHLWAHEESGIDFRKEKDRAVRCTVSFAAEELENIFISWALKPRSVIQKAAISMLC